MSKIGFVYKNEYTVEEERYFNMRLSTDSSDMWSHMVVLSQNNQVVFQNTSDRYSTKIIYEVTLYSNKTNPLTQEVSWT